MRSLKWWVVLIALGVALSGLLVLPEIIPDNQVQVQTEASQVPVPKVVPQLSKNAGVVEHISYWWEHVTMWWSDLPWYGPFILLIIALFGRLAVVLLLRLVVSIIVPMVRWAWGGTSAPPSNLTEMYSRPPTIEHSATAIIELQRWENRGRYARQQWTMFAVLLLAIFAVFWIIAPEGQIQRTIAMLWKPVALFVVGAVLLGGGLSKGADHWPGGLFAEIVQNMLIFFGALSTVVAIGFSITLLF